MMTTADDRRPVSPRRVVQQIAQSIPAEFRENIILIGSLAAGYYFFADDENMQVRTKDVDCLISPRVQAIAAGQAVAERLLQEGWELRREGEHGEPGDASTPDEQLPAVRLYPPGSTEWFIELLSAPEPGADPGRQWTRIRTSIGHFGLCSFSFLRLAEHKPIQLDLGIKIARPEMMALSNLVAHPSIGPETMNGLIEGREIKRSNKDLGRVLALVWLATSRDEDALIRWHLEWKEALRDLLEDQWRAQARRTASGLRELLGSEQDLDEALHTCVYGLLSSHRPTLQQLMIAGRRLLQDAVLPLEDDAKPR